MPSLKMSLTIAGVALVTFAVVAMFQRNVMPIPAVGSVLPR